MKRHLYLQIYLGVVGISVALLIAGGWFARHIWFGGDRAPHFLENAASAIAERVDGSEIESDQKLSLVIDGAGVGGVVAALYTAEGELIAATDNRTRHLERVRRRHEARGKGWARAHLPRIPGTSVQLEDGRWLRVSTGQRGRRGPGAGPFFSTLFVMVALAAGAYPVSRRITRRLERLQDGVEQLGEGDLTARVRVEGNDEVAELARAFNRSATRVESLVETQRRLLASASHELRTPLARLRVAIELLASEPRESLREEADRDIAELDELIEDLLLAARMQDPRPVQGEELDLLELAREEASHYQARVEGEGGTLYGNRRALRRMIRNLLENATRYGEPPIELRISESDADVVLCVDDAGPGVAPDERERVFEPFYRPHDHSEGEHGGVGLGLALVREIARHHGGDARCVERADGGSGFVVHLRDLAE